MKEVRWFCNQQTGFICMEDVSNELRFFEELAKDIFNKGNADHVIYASKEYAKNGNDLECVNFYNPPIELSDEEFEERTNGLENYIVYALHRHKKVPPKVELN